MAIDATGFNPSAWHDNLIYGLRLNPGDPDAGLWHSELLLDIDHIVEWICGGDGGVRFRVAPATLIFHDVTDLRLAVDLGDSGYANAINALSIDSIDRDPVRKAGAVGDLTYFRWRIALNAPRNGEIVFGASGATHTLRAAPVLLDQQYLPPGDRPPL